MRSKLSLLRIIISIIIIGIFTSCVRSDLPTGKERSSILREKKTIVLIRIKYDLEDGTLRGPFEGFGYPKVINIGLSSFLVGGKVKPVPHRFLSPETRKQGWMFLILKPGIHYIVVFGSQTSDLYTWMSDIRYAPRFRVNIPKNKPLVYIGTLYLHCQSRYVLFGEKSCDFFDRRRIVVQNEESLAEKLTTEYLSDFGPPQTLLMQFLH